MAKKLRRRTRNKTLPVERRRKIAGVLCVFIGLLLIGSLLTHSSVDDRLILEGGIDLVSLADSSELTLNRGGVVGAYFSVLLFFALGWAAFLPALWLLISSVWLWWPRIISQVARPAFLYSIFLTLTFALLDNQSNYETLQMTDDRSAIYILSSYGGFLSLQLNFIALKLFGGYGSTLALGALAVVTLLIALPRSVRLEAIPAPIKLIIRAPFAALGLIRSGLNNWAEKRRQRTVRRAEHFVTGGGLSGDIEEMNEDRMRNVLTLRRPMSLAETNSEEADPSAPPTILNKPYKNADLFSSTGDDSEQGGEAIPSDIYLSPDIDILNDSPRVNRREDTTEMNATANELRETLATFGINISGEVTMIPGPVVTRYEFRPAMGVKVNRILNLADDLALSLRAKRIRIVAPIPGKAAVGIEVPISKRETVFLKDIISTRQFNSPGIRLPLALGKGSSGEPFVADLSKMPHLLIAGATGSGKSVCINIIITSLLYRLDPSELRFIFIDPKMLELSVYAGIPHLERPVVTNPRKAERVLADAVIEMEDRYKKLAAHSVRNIRDYNSKMTDPARQLPYLVIVVDELADLMMTQTSAKTELLITRLAQMARAVGIHLILATQRPSVDVITGLIKANFPSRIAFHVASKIDSRTILDGNGAEKLLGQGDMLFQMAGHPEVVRLHGALISGEETENIVASLRSQKIKVERIENVSKEIPDDDSDSPNGSEKVDPIYLEAIETVLHHRQGSVSLLQRRLGIGYQRAARLIDRLEEGGIVGPYDGSKARQVLVDQTYLDSMKAPENFSDGQSAEQVTG